MKRRMIFAIVLSGFLTLLVSSTGYGIPLNKPVQEQIGSLKVDLSTNTTIPYTGNLTDKDGNPVTDGIYSFKFVLFEDQNNNELIWSEEHQKVEVESSVFTIQLGSEHPIPEQALKSDQGFLQIAVRAAKDESYTTLNPPQILQPISAADPESINAQAACAHDHLGEEWTFDSSTAGLTIENKSTVAVHGISSGSDSYGIWGENAAFTGVRGDSDSGIGVHGKSNSSFGVRGDSDTLVGVWGKSNTGSGVYGASVSFFGVRGQSEEYYGGYFKSDVESHDLALGGPIGRINARDDEHSQLYLSSNADLILKLDNDGGENHVLRVKNSGGNDVCTIDEDGNLWCKGTISSDVTTAQESAGLLTATDNTEFIFEDFGVGTLENGKTYIEFGQITLEKLDFGDNYFVFLTPVCDQPNVLNVSSKTTSGFSVHGVTLEGIPSNCTFDYRIVAKRRDYENLRLERVSTNLEETP